MLMMWRLCRANPSKTPIITLTCCVMLKLITNCDTSRSGCCKCRLHPSARRFNEPLADCRRKPNKHLWSITVASRGSQDSKRQQTIILNLWTAATWLKRSDRDEGKDLWWTQESLNGRASASWWMTRRCEDLCGGAGDAEKPSARVPQEISRVLR